jgi:RNA polymerase sigma-70 factor (ECF subfamily)
VTIERESGLAASHVATTFDDFYASTARRTLSLAYVLTGNWGDAEDLVQDAYAVAAKRWAEIGSYDDPSAWVRRVVLNRSVSRRRRLQREALAVVRLGNRTDERVVDDDPMDPVFWAAVRRLPPQQSRAVALFYVNDLSVEQIARVLACAEGTVKTHLSRARTTLGRRLQMEDES